MPRFASSHDDIDTAYTLTLDDDPIVCKLIEEFLGVKNFSFSSAQDLLRSSELFRPTGIFIDVHLAKNECGLDVIPQVRKCWPDAPIIVITSDDSNDHIGQALAAGANDFILKPFGASELIARLSSRREELKDRNSQWIVSYGDLELDLQKKILSSPLGQVYISSKEADIFAYLVRQSGIVVEKGIIKRHVWGSVKVSDNALERKIFEVRKTVRTLSSKVEIKTVYGKGLVLRLNSFACDQELLEDKEVLLGVSSLWEGRGDTTY